MGIFGLKSSGIIYTSTISVYVISSLGWNVQFRFLLLPPSASCNSFRCLLFLWSKLVTCGWLPSLTQIHTFPAWNFFFHRDWVLVETVAGDKTAWKLNMHKPLGYFQPPKRVPSVHYWCIYVTPLSMEPTRQSSSRNPVRARPLVITYLWSSNHAM